MSNNTTKFLLPESEIPRAWLNIVPFLPSPPPPALHPGTKQPAGPDDFAPLFPMDLILQEVSNDQYVEIPEEVLRGLPNLASDATYSCASPGEGPRHASAPVLQVRGDVARRFAQAQHRGAPGVLQQEGGREEASPPRPVRASGARRCRLPARNSDSSRNLAGASVLRRKTVPSPHDGDVRGHGAPVPSERHRIGPSVPGRRIRTRPARSAWPFQRSGRGCRDGR